MNKQDFENLIKDKSVDEMIDMMPVIIRVDPPRDQYEYALKIHRNKFEDRYLLIYEDIDRVSIMRVVTGSYGKRNEVVQSMLLWLFDHNLLPEYTKGNNRLA